MKRIRACPSYWVTKGGTVLNPLGKEVKQRRGKVFICGQWLEVSTLRKPRKLKPRLSPEMKQFVLSYKGDTASCRLAFLATFGRTISYTSYYNIRKHHGTT